MDKFVYMNSFGGAHPSIGINPETYRYKRGDLTGLKYSKELKSKQYNPD
jgi:hypothetical protein